MEPIDAPTFAACMAPLGPFEPRPRIAVGVSGGADSLALTLLMHDWAAARGGAVLALTVDHRLRPEAAEEAGQVGRWLAGRGIAHRVLAWEADKPATGLQDAARTARRRLLVDCCFEHGILHLALAHHREDQAETVLLRFAKGSGIDGLAGMPALTEAGPVRLLRPLLGLPRARLAATCRAAGQPWIEDPSNGSPAFARGRLRAVADVLAAEGLTPDRLADTAHRAGAARAALETDTAALLARAVRLFPEGWLSLDPALLRAVPEEVALRALAACLATIGGTPHPPRRAAVERLYGDLPAEGRTLDLPADLAAKGRRGRTLAGCRILFRARDWLVLREAAAIAGPAAIVPGGTVRWDGRFAVRLDAQAPPGRYAVAAAGGRTGLPGMPAGLPATVRATLPVLERDGRPVGVPPTDPGSPVGDIPAVARFSPCHPLARPPFLVVSAVGGII